MKRLTLFVLSAMLLLLGPALSSAAVNLPAPNPPVNSILYGDFYSYSLPLLGINVDSTPGQIKDDIVIATGAAGVPVTTNSGNMDDAYLTPTGVGPESFNTATIADPAPVLLADPVGLGPASRWTSEVSALRTFLVGDGGDLVFFFNMHDPNAGTGVYTFPEDQDMVAWGKVQLIDLAAVLPTKTYFLNSPGFDQLNDAYTGPDETAALATILADPNWAQVHGQVTATPNGDGSYTFIHYGRKTGADPAAAVTINQNLGADEAAFALYNPELDALVRDALSGYDVLQLDLKMALLHNGFEQAFVLSDTTVDDIPKAVPEPATVLIWSVLAGMGIFAGWRRRKAA